MLAAYDLSLIEFIKGKGKVTKQELLEEYALQKSGQEDIQLNEDLHKLINADCIGYNEPYYYFIKNLE